ncbi:MAG: hypothetical protein IJ615_01045 [Bacteroidaceae bacterium]|nr:hypothetical protein [Bacteroidaceae bacterium]
MRRLYIIMAVMLAVLSMASCRGLKPDRQSDRQLETVDNLMDSLIDRGDQVYHYIICNGDSTYQDERWFHYFYDEENKNVHQSSLLFLSAETPDLLDKLCRKAEKSYRYNEGDSLGYSITMRSKPLELISFRHYKNEKDGETVSLTHTTMRHAKHSAAPYDPQPIQAVLQKFLAEQKDVKTYDVCYEWDEGVPFADLDGGRVQLIDQWKGQGTDSLAAAKVTGTLYDVTIRGEGRADSANADLNRRMTKLITERPIEGAWLSSYYPGGKMKYSYLQGIKLCDWQKRKKFYDLNVQNEGERLHILELQAADAPRFAKPINWWVVKQIQGDKVSYMNLER